MGGGAADMTAPSAVNEDANEDSNWPDAKFRRRLAEATGPSQAGQAGQAGGSGGERKRYCVVLSTGAMNPLHRGHVHMLEAAKACLESQPPVTDSTTGTADTWKVLAGWISPSHQLYVGPKCQKLGTICLPAEDRVALVQAACRESEWLSVGRWETSQTGYWPDFPEVRVNQCVC